jgi:hypothetical protein
LNNFLRPFFIIGSEESVRVKRLRADSTPVAREPAQALDAPEPEEAAVPAPPSFLSPSVKEYLELGMAIPGKTFFLNHNHSIKQSHWPLSVPIYAQVFKTTQRIFMRFFIYRVIQVEGLYVYNEI